MKVLCDTSVLVAALMQAHPAHSRALSWLVRARSGEIEVVLSAHSLAELYSVLTRIPLKPQIPPGEIWKLVEEGVLSHCIVIALEPAEYASVLRRLSSEGIGGGPTYDALIAAVAQKSNVDQVITLNVAHFVRVCSELAPIIMEP